jgi:hypothetical protein
VEGSPSRRTLMSPLRNVPSGSFCNHTWQSSPSAVPMHYCVYIWLGSFCRLKHHHALTFASCCTQALHMHPLKGVDGYIPTVSLCKRGGTPCRSMCPVDGSRSSGQRAHGEAGHMIVFDGWAVESARIPLLSCSCCKAGQGSLLVGTITDRLWTTWGTSRCPTCLL